MNGPMNGPTNGPMDQMGDWMTLEAGGVVGTTGAVGGTPNVQAADEGDGGGGIHAAGGRRLHNGIEEGGRVAVARWPWPWPWPWHGREERGEGREREREREREN